MRHGNLPDDRNGNAKIVVAQYVNGFIQVKAMNFFNQRTQKITSKLVFILRRCVLSDFVTQKCESRKTASSL